jgi:hypothetical protein
MDDAIPDFAEFIAALGPATRPSDESFNRTGDHCGLWAGWAASSDFYLDCDLPEMLIGLHAVAYKLPR